MRLDPSSLRVFCALIPALLAAPLLLGGPPADDPLFEKPIANDQLTFLNKYDGRASDHVLHDGKYKKIIQTVVPAFPIRFRVDDESLSNTLETVLQSVPLPVEIHDGRYVMIASRGTPTLRGKGFCGLTCRKASPWAGFFSFREMASRRRRSQFSQTRWSRKRS